MKKTGHPKYRKVLFVDTATGTKFICGSSVQTKEEETVNGVVYPVYRLSISAASHPLFTGEKRFLDAEGRVDKFRRRYAMKDSAAVASQATSTTTATTSATTAPAAVVASPASAKVQAVKQAKANAASTASAAPSKAQTQPAAQPAAKSASKPAAKPASAPTPALASAAKSPAGAAKPPAGKAPVASKPKK